MKSEFSNQLLKRREVKHTISKDSNPGFAESAKEIASHFKTKEELVVVRSVHSGYGKSQFIIDAYIYESPEAKEIAEPKPKKKKEKSN